MTVTHTTVTDARLNTSSTGNTTTVETTTTTTTATTTTISTTFIRVVVTANGTKLLHSDDLGENGTEFYAALLHQAQRWDEFVGRGAEAVIPSIDQRYADTANSLLTMYMNTDQGLIPEYGAGQVNAKPSYNCVLVQPPASRVLVA
jgi:hypothetical protein